MTGCSMLKLSMSKSQIDLFRYRSFLNITTNCMTSNAFLLVQCLQKSIPITKVTSICGVPMNIAWNLHNYTAECNEYMNNICNEQFVMNEFDLNNIQICNVHMLSM